MGYCIPDMSELNVTRPGAVDLWTAAFESMLTSNPAGRSVQDLYLASRAIYISMAMSFVYCILFIYLMSIFAECIAWGIIILVQLGMIGATIFSFGTYVAKMNDLDG